MKKSSFNSLYTRDSAEAGNLAHSISPFDIAAALERREAVLRATALAAGRFLVGDWRDFISDFLRDLGLGADISRVFLFQIRPNDEGELRHFQTHEWCADGIRPHIDLPKLQNFHLRDIGLERWDNELGNDLSVQGVVAELPEQERAILEELQIQSIVVVPITVKGQWWGCFGFEECRKARQWEKIEVECLRLSADILAAAIERADSDAALRDSENEMSALFNAMRDPVFVIDHRDVYQKFFACDESLLARPACELIGRAVADVFEPPLAELFTEVMAQVRRENRLINFQYPLMLAGQQKWFSANVTPLKDNGILWIARDITEAHLARTEMQQREELFRLLAENSSDCLSICKYDGTLIYISPVVERIFGYKAEELCGNNNFERVHPEDMAELMMNIEKALENPGIYYTVEIRLLHHAGHWMWTEITGHAVTNGRGEVEIHTVSRDVTQRRAGEEALRQAEEKYRSIFENAVGGIFQTTPDGYYLDANPSLARIYGFESVAELRADLSDIASQLYVDPKRRNAFTERIESGGEVSNFESQIRRKDGTQIWISENARVVRDDKGAILYYEGTVEDITVMREGKERLLYDALHDQLTGLSNRALFMDRLEQTFARLKRNSDALFAVLFLDFDRFKNINDSLGHLAGDQLLQAISMRLQECLRPGDTISRFGGDEFAILLERVKEPSEAILVAERVQRALREPFQLGSQQVFSSASIGIALGHTDYERAEDLLRDADMAMYRAKARGKARHEIFDADMHTRAVALLQLETDLRWAIERDEFRLYYQPIVRLEDSAVVGFEALIRWQHPQRGLVPPDEFIPIAEETGWIVPIGKWVLEEACAQLSKWQNSIHIEEPLWMSVNLSSKQFSQPDLIELIETTIAASSIAPGSLTLEITESAIMEDVQTVTNRLLQLRNLGVKLGLDDFGTGYSSLSYLHRFPLNTLKIDRSFVARLLEDSENREIVRTIITLGKNLGMDVVAEGVEEAQQLSDLRDLNCQQGQGYFFARPLPAEEAILILTAPPLA